MINAIDTYGEVFTPPSLVEEMLNLLPEKVWLNKEYRWIDHSCGEGIFLQAIKSRLLKYHTEEHIVNNMLYGIDIQENNVEITKRDTGIKNIICGDALSCVWNTKFDIVVGNPPYNNPKSTKKGNNTNPLWPKFVLLSLNSLLKKGGYLLHVHPPLWRKPEHFLWGMMKTLQIEKVVMLTQQKSSSLFGVMTKVDFYLLQNKRTHKRTEIIDEEGIKYKVRLDSRPFLPNSNITEVYKVFNGSSEVIYSCDYHHYTQKHMSKITDTIFKYPCVYLRNKKGTTLYYSSINTRGHFGRPKIIIPFGCYLPILDEEGSLGMCEVAMGLPIKNKSHGETLLKALTSEKFIHLLNSCRWKTVQLDYRLFKYLNIPALIGEE